MKAFAGVNAGIGMPSARSEDAASTVDGSRAIAGAAARATAGAIGRTGVATKASAAATRSRRAKQRILMMTIATCAARATTEHW